MAISRCGLPLPLPVDFDTDAHMARPADVSPPSHFDLQDKNAKNVRIEMSNKISIAFTRAFATPHANGTIGTLDVGASLTAFFEYSEAEKTLLMGSAPVVVAIGPLPVYMTMWIAAEQLKVSVAEAAEKARRDKERDPREAEKAWQKRPSLSAPSRTALLSAPANHIVNVKKALIELGDEDVKLLIKFFASLDCFEDGDLLPVWYAVERRLRCAILGGGLHNEQLYKSCVDNALSNHDQMCDLRLGFVPVLLVTSLRKRRVLVEAVSAPHLWPAKVEALHVGGRIVIRRVRATTRLLV
ncbi:hypothetical protein B0H10DRAFT_2433552 [Mycena sp. CBHHK59/15]|nr:hypothetical protein B0H10DRAFT_2433552 [Mycena sp. CBHHK59/15]